MRNKGYALSAIVYPLLLVCLVLILSILFNLNNKQNVLNNLKDIIKNENNEVMSLCDYAIGHKWTFDYSGNPEEFIVPCAGTYQLEVWGAQGGTITISEDTIYQGGYGAYSTGSVNLQKDNNLYVVVGGAGTSQINPASETQITYGGYNGGANAVGRYTGSTTAVQYNASGGGATHIGTFNDTLADHGSTDGLYIVAGGGGGSAYFYVSSSSYSFSNGGHAGGIEGSKFELISGTTQSWICGNVNATQSSGGKTCYYNTWYGPSTFGAGSLANAGGGSGLYGGAGGQIGGNGGSSYINNSELYNKVMYCYNCKESDVEGTKTITTTNVSSSPVSEYAKTGNGYAVITLVALDNKPTVEVEVVTNKANFTMTDDFGVVAYGVSKSETEEPEYTSIESTTNTTQTWTATEVGTYYVWVKDTSGNITIESFEILNVCSYEIGQTWAFDYSGSPEEFTVPCNGAYKLEVWGAQGGNATTTYIGGLGGYSYGNAKLDLGDVLYVTVGGQGGNATGNNLTAAGGYNGGGSALTTNYNANYINSGGGGATHIALGTTNRGELYNYENYKSELLIVAGGGGGGSYWDAYYSGKGGTGGGISGSNAVYITGTENTYGTGASQTAGGYCAYNTTYNPGYFGKASTTTYNFNNQSGGGASGAGGGGGYYSGGGGCQAGQGGGGGSGYIGGVTDGTTENGVRTGNGYAQITLVSID